MTEFTIYTQLYYQIMYMSGNSDKAYTVETLSKSLHQPAAIVREVLLCLLDGARYNQDLDNYLPFLNGKSLLSLSDSEIRKFRNGELDDNRIEFFPSGSCIVITEEEMKRLHKILNIPTPSYNKSFKKKNIEKSGSDIDFIIVNNEERTALHEENTNKELLKKVYFNLESKNATQCIRINTNEKYNVFGIYYVFEQSGFYAVSEKISKDDNKIHFIPFSELKDLNNTRFLTKNWLQKNQEIQKYLWAPESIETDVKPTCFRIQLNHLETGNTKAKILRDLSKFSYTIISQNEKHIILEFSIIPTPKFYSWLLSFGSSVCVLSPEDTREWIIGEYRKIWEIHVK